MEAIGLFLALGGLIEIFGWVLLGVIGAILGVVFWIVWLFRWNKLGDGD